jgi:hypothetical protein
MAKKFDPKAKAKRQKIIAAVGGVLLLGLLAFQVPRTLKMLHQSNANAAATTTSSATGPTGTTGSLAPPSLAGGNGTGSAAVNVSSDGVSDPDVLPAPQSGQLLAFSRFQTKDPFAQQLNLDCAGGSSESCPGGTAKATTPGNGSTAPKPSDGGRSGDTTPTPRVLVVKLTAAVISVNGVAETVDAGSTFPASNPTFRLVSVTKTTAKIGIAGGTLASGGQTVTLTRNKPLTLMNTADGTRYVLRLLSVK